MAEVKVFVANDTGSYATTVHTETGNHRFISDEPESNNGTNKGPEPFSLLLASLGSCTTITLRMYADRKEWPLEKTEIDLHLKTENRNGQFQTFIFMNVQFHGPLTEEQKIRLLEIANACPIHKMLSHPIHIRTNAD